MLLLRCYASALVQQCPYELLNAVTVVDHRSIATEAQFRALWRLYRCNCWCAARSACCIAPVHSMMHAAVVQASQKQPWLLLPQEQALASAVVVVE
jgi:hypothetical protein